MTTQLELTHNGTAMLEKFTTVPYSLEAEEATLGCILINPDAFASVASFLREEDFFLLRNAYVWRAMVRLDERDDLIDLMTLSAELKALNLFEQINGLAYLMHLTNTQATSIHAEVYARLVQRAAVRRRLLVARDEIAALAMDETLSIQQVVERAQQKLDAAASRVLIDSISPIREAVGEHFDRLETHLAEPEAPIGVPTGLRQIDELLGGLRKRRVYYVGARTHMGKTSLALTVALNAARLGAAPMIVTMEETLEDLTNRLLALELGIEVDRLAKGALNEGEYKRYVEAAGRIGSMNLCIDAVPSITPKTLAQHVGAQQSRSRVDLVIVDYLQLMSAGPYDRDGEYAKLLYITRTLPVVARKCNIPIWCNVQVNRGVEKRDDKRPQLADFEGCGKIEQGADVALVLYRDGFYNTGTVYPDQVEVIVRKNKVNGKKGTVNLRFDDHSTRFTDWTAQTAREG